MVSSGDGDFALSLRLRVQLRHETIAEPKQQTRQGLLIRRGRALFKGHVYGRDNRFKLELAVSPRDQGLSETGPSRTPLLDWYVDFTHLRDASLRVGQHKVYFSRERVISSGNLQLVDRSITNSAFSLDRDVGIVLFSKDLGGLELFKYYLTVANGDGRGPTGPSNLDMMYIMRVEVLPFGHFDDYSEVDFVRDSGPGFSLGAAYAYHAGARRQRGNLGSVPSDGGTTDFYQGTVDAILKVGGASATAAWFMRRGFRNPGSQADEDGVVNVSAPADGMGAYGQLGFQVPRIPLELAARYSVIRGASSTELDDRPSTLSDANELGGGVSYYFARHPLKLQADYFRLWGDDSHGSDQVRVQLQASF